jgi:hypothetical protein
MEEVWSKWVGELVVGELVVVFVCLSFVVYPYPEVVVDDIIFLVFPGFKKVESRG